jgi:non-specific serine/threonine protein kinase
MSTDQYDTAANGVLAESAEPPLTLGEFVERLFENPEYGENSAQYILRAIESYGTRTVLENGEELERYCIFDDPADGGKHAILGNTDVLNDFVEDIRQIGSRYGKKQKILWFEGPTATGKSELKRCLINGVRAFSQTSEGRRYTVEWNISAISGGGLSYSNSGPLDDEAWYESPVQANPLLVYPQPVRDQIVRDLASTGTYLDIEGELDPFSKEAHRLLTEHYEADKTDNLFTSLTAPRHLRVKRYTMDMGQGIGILHSEDEGSPKERLVGSWVPTLLKQLDSRGRKNPQAFSYDGLLAQGNGGLSIVEDASQHFDLLRKLLNIPEERLVKLDKGLPMSIDTVLIIISNPDLEMQLDQYSEKTLSSDPLRALRRRLDKYYFRYLTSLSLEAELLRREVGNLRRVPTENLHDRISEPLKIGNAELSPHAIEAAALYSIVSRVRPDNWTCINEEYKDMEFSFVEKALLYEHGHIETEDGRLTMNDFEFESDEKLLDGRIGIPVTFTRDVLTNMCQQSDVILPQDILSSMDDELESEPIFSQKERELFHSRVDEVGDYLLEQQESDILAAIMMEQSASEDAINDYISNVYSWGFDDSQEEPDDLRMKVFETTHLGWDDDDYNDLHPKREVRDWRHETIINRLNRYLWENRKEGFTIETINIAQTPVVANLFDGYEWGDVKRAYPNFDPHEWRDASSGTETMSVKESSIENLCEVFGYSTKSAARTAAYVIDEVKETWE